MTSLALLGGPRYILCDAGWSGVSRAAVGMFSTAVSFIPCDVLVKQSHHNDPYPN